MLSKSGSDGDGGAIQGGAAFVGTGGEVLIGGEGVVAFVGVGGEVLIGGEGDAAFVGVGVRIGGLFGTGGPSTVVDGTDFATASTGRHATCCVHPVSAIGAGTYFG